MSKVVIVARRFLAPDGSVAVGGVETYVEQLADALAGRFSLLVAQTGSETRETRAGKYLVLTVDAPSIRSLLAHLRTRVLAEGDTLLFSTEQYGANPEWKRHLVVQHGIYWDLPTSCYGRVPGALLGGAYKWYDNFRNLRRIGRFANVVCVDYAYLHWLRCHTSRLDRNIWVIPNCPGSRYFSIPIDSAPADGRIRILFPRRLEHIRGTQLFAGVARQLLESFPEVTITICGTGPEEARMKASLPPSPRLEYMFCRHEEMPEVMARHDIVVIPSLGSEGTTFAAVEAMAAARSIVATNVGGLTSLLIDGFNGLLCDPASEPLTHALRTLVLCPDLRRTLQENARATAAGGFSFESWRRRWLEVMAAVGA